MKILHITATHLRPTGGVVVVLKNLSAAQNKVDGVESKVLSIVYDIDEVGSGDFFYLGTRDIYGFLKDYHPDLVILHSFFCKEYIKTARALAKLKVPYFIEPHSSFCKSAMKKSHLKKTIANNTIFRSLIKNSVGYIFTNKSEFDTSVYRTENDLVIYNGVDPDIISQACEKKVDSYNDPTLYFLGRYDIHHKGLDYLFDALDILDERGCKIKINLYGTGDDKQIKYVHYRISRYTTVNAIDCGTIYGEDKKAALEDVNILILTSRYEGLPMTVWDGLSYGNPCIATPGTNLADELSTNMVGWRAELSAESIADTIITALDDYRGHGHEYFERCRKYVLSNFSWNKIGSESVDQYRSVLNRIR